jgi:hypothetical protein
MQSLRRVRRVRGPVITWTPAHESFHVLASVLRSTRGTPPLHLAQAAILKFEEHIRADPSPLPFGLLVGHLCVCPKTKLEYLLVDGVAHARMELTAADPTAQLAAELRALMADSERHDKLVLGWYIGGMGAELQLDLEAVSLHRVLFPEPWQVVLLHDNTSGVERASLLRFEPITEQSYTIPFFELLPEQKARDQRLGLCTALRWANYRTTDPVVPLRDPAAGQTAAGRSTAATPARLTPNGWLARFHRTNAVATRTETPRRSQPEPPRRSIDVTVGKIDTASSAEPDLDAYRQAPVPPSSRNGAAATPIAAGAAPAAAEVQVTTESVVADSAGDTPTRPLQHVFIDGDVIAFPDVPMDAMEEQSSPNFDRRGLVALIVVALVLLFALSIYWRAH